MLTNDCTPKSTPNPKQNSFPCSVGALEPVIKHSTTMANNNNITAAAPTNPNSSPTIAKIKSVCDSGRKLPSFTERTFPLSLKPFPVKPPEPMARIEFSCCHLSSLDDWESLSLFKKLSIL